MPSWTAPLGKLGSHRRQTVDAIVKVFHRLAADGYETSRRQIAQATKWRCPARECGCAAAACVCPAKERQPFSEFSPSVAR